MSGFIHRHYLCGMDEHGFDCTSKQCEEDILGREGRLRALRDQMKEITSSFNPREQKILEMRFGLVDNVSHTLEEVGEEFGVTRERIRQIEAKALEKIRETFEEKIRETFDVKY